MDAGNLIINIRLYLDRIKKGLLTFKSADLLN